MSDLQQLIHDLQLDPTLQGDSELQRIAQTLQSELHAWEQRPQAYAAPPIILSPSEQRAWASLQAFFAMLNEYCGWVNRDQWLKLLDIAADLVTGEGAMGEKGAQGDPGPAGPPGAPGSTGPAGPAGSPGANGANGATGPAGPQGVPGQGLTILGQYDTSGQLIAAHPTGTEGDAYLVGMTDPKHLYLWFDGAWHDVGPLTGVGIDEAPTTTAQPYARNGLSGTWELVTHDGGTW